MDSSEINRTLDVFATGNGLMEIRIFSTVNKSEIYSGIFDNRADLVREVGRFDKDPYNIYFVFNELKDALDGMPQLNRMMRGARTVSDKDIKYRRWLMFDFDPVREGDVKDIASTDEEMENARQTALAARRYLRQNGFSAPVVCRSGNGYHFQFRLDNLPCTDETNRVCANVLKYVAMQFTDEKVDCDVKVSNPARLTKLYGSVSRKGGNTATRPHRKSEIVLVPTSIEKTPYEALKRLSDAYERAAAQSEPPVQARGHAGGAAKFDLDAFLEANGLEVLKETRTADGGRKLVLKQCPFDPAHGKDSAIFVSPQGATAFTCFHAGCSGHGWKELRLKFDPHAYDRVEYPPEPRRPYGRGYAPPQRAYEVRKEEDPGLGKKWLCMSDIAKVDLSEIESIKTGFTQLDRLIVGLYVGEVSIISGNNSSGKSSWINSLVLNAIEGGWKCALWSGELPAYILKTWIQMVAAGRRHLRPSIKDSGKYYVPQETGRRIDRWMDGKFFLYNNEYTNKWEQIFHDMEELCAMGVKLFILDNLFSLDIDLFDGDKNNKQKELILQICRFAKDKKVHLMLVAHPRKVTTLLRKTDISGSSDLTNAVDNVFIVHRVNNDFIKAGTDFWGKPELERYTVYSNCIEVAKNRMYGVVDQICGMYFETESRRFKNAREDDFDYGWAGEAAQRPIFGQPAGEGDYGFLEQQLPEAPF